MNTTQTDLHTVTANEIDAQVYDLIVRAKKIVENIDETNKEIKQDIHDVHTEVNNTVRQLTSLYAELDEIEKVAMDELDSLMLDQAEELVTDR